jgi:NADPH-ferrihemoprotein reductase
MVYWGSQSGRAERLAARLARECTARLGLRVAVADLDDHDHEHLSEVPCSKLIVFVVSTFGEGDPTDNSVTFCSVLKALRATGNTQLLTHLRYAVFGLGNRNYRHYNKIVDLVDTTLQELGARRIGTVGKADEAKGGTATDEDFLEWSNSMLESIGEMFGVEKRPMVYSPELDVVAADPKTEVIMAREAQSNINILAAPMVAARVLTNGLDRRCFHLEFDLSSNRSIKYQTGDHLLVWPHNSVSDVRGLCRLLGLGEMERTQPVEIKSRLQGGNYSTAFPSPTTKETVLRHYLDISGPVSRDVSRQLAAFSPTPAAGEYLLALAKEKAKFHTTVSLGHLSLANVMQLAAGDQVWNQLPFTFLLECLGKLQPRYYSIASSPSVSPFQPAITLAITRKALDASSCGAHLQRSHLQRSHFHGVASNYLLAVKRSQKSNGNSDSQQPLDEGPDYGSINNQVLIQIRRSTFKLPANPQRPIVMIAAGTGVAPFRAFVQERAAMAARGLPVGGSLLLFGCRSPTEDYLYENEWRHHVATLPGFEVINAFSRYSEKKVYVQDKLLEVKDRIAGLLEKDAAVYICGSADMAREVRRALMKVVMEMRNWTEEEAERYVMEDMKKAKRLQEDVWSG